MAATSAALWSTTAKSRVGRVVARGHVEGHYQGGLAGVPGVDNDGLFVGGLVRARRPVHFDAVGAQVVVGRGVGVLLAVAVQDDPHVDAAGSV